MKTKKQTDSARIHISQKQQLFVFGGLVVMLAGLFGVFGLVGNFLGKAPADTYSECLHANGSRLLESYPEICVTKAGKRFQNPKQVIAAPKNNV